MIRDVNLLNSGKAVALYHTICTCTLRTYIIYMLYGIQDPRP